MLLHCIPSALCAQLRTFEPCFTAPGFRHFVALMTGWILARGRHQLTRVFRMARALGYTAHHSSLYRFLSAGRWCLDSVGGVLVQLLLPFMGSRVVALVDDSLCRKCGSQIFGTGVHHDAARSTYNRRGRRVIAFGFGHNWVTLALWVPCPWLAGRGWAVPVLFRLYRQKARCPCSLYRKRTELAAELIGLLATLLPSDRRLVVAGDAAYCCKTVLRALPAGVDFVGPLPLDAALYGLPAPHSGCGRPRRKGYRLANPRTLAARPRAWTRRVADLYGRSVSLNVMSRVCLWYPSAGHRPVRVVITRDPKRRAEIRAYVATDADLDPVLVLSLYSRRWQLEVTFREMKQELGFEDPQNGFWRRRRGLRANTRRHAPKPRAHHGERAVARTAPLAGIAYALTLLWYLQQGDIQRDVARARRDAPWYQHKSTPSFQDMRNALCREIRRRRFRRILRWARLRQNDRDLQAFEELAA